MSEQSGSNTTQSIADYLAQLLKDRKQVTAFPNVFIHVERLIDEGKNAREISLKSRGASSGSALSPRGSSGPVLSSGKSDSGGNPLSVRPVLRPSPGPYSR